MEDILVDTNYLQESETRLYFPQSTFDKKQAGLSNNSSQSNSSNNSRLFEQRSNFNSPPSRSNRTEAKSDWIDVKSNNYFAQNSRDKDKLGGKKQSNGKKPEWRNVYGKASQPAEGAVNAFQWSD